MCQEQKPRDYVGEFMMLALTLGVLAAIPVSMFWIAYECYQGRWQHPPGEFSGGVVVGVTLGVIFILFYAAWTIQAIVQSRSK